MIPDYNSVIKTHSMLKIYDKMKYPVDIVFSQTNTTISIFKFSKYGHILTKNSAYIVMNTTK
nr:hypothetical protein CJLB15_00112 [Campylobacter phage CJLB-15]